jgi:hypothetical protein
MVVVVVVVVMVRRWCVVVGSGAFGLSPAPTYNPKHTNTHTHTHTHTHTDRHRHRHTHPPNPTTTHLAQQRDDRRQALLERGLDPLDHHAPALVGHLELLPVARGEARVGHHGRVGALPPVVRHGRRQVEVQPVPRRVDAEVEEGVGVDVPVLLCADLELEHVGQDVLVRDEEGDLRGGAPQVQRPHGGVGVHRARPRRRGQELAEEEVDGGPAVDPFLLPGHDAGEVVLEVEGARRVVGHVLAHGRHDGLALLGEQLPHPAWLSRWWWCSSRGIHGERGGDG